MIKKMMFLKTVVFLVFLTVSAYGGDRTRSDIIVLPVNDLGMHCMDGEYAFFSLLPPFNVLNAQVLFRNPSGYPILYDFQDVKVDYSETADPNGSINSWSLGKTDFWDHASRLFGIPLNPGEGLLGFYMPGDAPIPGPQDMPYDGANQWFSAVGIPITPLDDALQTNTYPMMTVSARDPLFGTLLGATEAVLPISSETSCRNCHHDASGSFPGGPVPYGITDEAIERLTKSNILKLHDQLEGTALFANRPVLCADCHYSAALDLAGTGPSGSQIGKPSLSEAMHRYHGKLLDASGNPVFPPNGTMNETCYQCHPGKDTQCLRGPMAAGGMTCLSCHGNMLAVGGEYPLLPGGSMDGTNDGNPRRPWLDLPRCQACHTGDAVDHLAGPEYLSAPDGLRLFQAYKIGDPSASPLLAVNKRFAENDKTRYRFSKGHGGLMCEACHGSTHAEWPVAKADANDNVTATELQGHPGPLIECGTCHAAGTLPLTENGPHGLHNVAEKKWYDHDHEDFYEANKTQCKACHGLDLMGTPLSRAATDRTFYVKGKKKEFKKGQMIGCYHCHKKPN